MGAKGTIDQLRNQIERHNQIHDKSMKSQADDFNDIIKGLKDSNAIVQTLLTNEEAKKNEAEAIIAEKSRQIDSLTQKLSEKNPMINRLETMLIILVLLCSWYWIRTTFMNF